MEPKTTTTIQSTESNGHSVETIARELSALFQTEANTHTIFGEPIQLETRKIIPIASIEIGAGGGGGFGQSFAAEAVKEAIETAKRLVPSARGAGGGGGLGVKVRPVGYLSEENGRVVFTAIPGR
jgi:uncharacterized spore protein YtfJ